MPRSAHVGKGARRGTAVPPLVRRISLPVLLSRSIFLHVSGLSKAHVAWSRNGDGPSDGMILLMKARAWTGTWADS